MVDYIHYARLAISSSSSILKLAYYLAENGTNQQFYKTVYQL